MNGITVKTVQEKEHPPKERANKERRENKRKQCEATVNGQQGKSFGAVQKSATLSIGVVIKTTVLEN